MRRYNNIIQNATGQAIAGAVVTVTKASIPPGTGLGATLFSDDGLTQIPNTVVADALGRFAFFAPDGKYDLTITGGTPAVTVPYVLAAESIQDLLEFNTLDTQPIAVQTLNLTELTSGATPPTGTINLYSKLVDGRLYYKDSTGTEVGPLVTSGGGTGSPAGFSGDVQKNSGIGPFAPSSINDNGSRVLVSENTIFRGPNLGVDVTAFGVRPINPNVVPSPTATISSGSNLAAVSSTVGLQIGDGLAVVGAGAAHGMPTPVAPTVTPSCAASLTGLGYTVAGGAGSTTYQYQIVMRDVGQGITAASTVAITTTGSATLGPNNTAITSIASGTSNVFTATVASTANLVVGAMVLIKGTTNDAEFGGWKIVQSIVDGSNFTYTSGIDASRGISTTTATGGAVSFWLCNHLVLPTPSASGTQYLIYGRTAGSMTFLGSSLLANLGYTDSSYNTWDDYGSPMMDGPPKPWWAPTTPPVASVNDSLVTTITGIAGTTLTLANNASTSVTSSPSRFDNVPGIKAALAATANSVLGGGGTLRFPPVSENPATGNFSYITSSYLVLAASVIQDGAVTLGDTLQLNGNWYGTDYSSTRATSLPNNAFRTHIPISLQGANPGIFVRGLGGLNKVNLSISGNGGVGVFATGLGSIAQMYEDCNFGSGGSGDFMSILFYDYESTSSGGFGGKFRNCTFTTGGVTNGYGTTATPAWVSKYNVEWDFDYFSGTLRGLAFVPFNAGLFANIHMGEEFNGPIMPVVTVIPQTVGNTSGAFKISQAVIDTGSVPLLANLGPANAFTNADIVIEGGNLPSGGQALISGNLFFGSVQFIGLSPGRQAGQNVNVSSLGRNANFTAGLQTSSVNEAIVGYTASHTLVANEAAVVALASLTFTVDASLNGQAWDVFSDTGTTTITAINGTLHGNGATGSFVLPNNRGVRVVVRSGNAYALGL